MHPVQAAPRQRQMMKVYNVVAADAPRAGSAEAKNRIRMRDLSEPRCTPCRQRTAK